MLRNTFCHIPGIGEKSEKRLWSAGILCWEDFLASQDHNLPKVNDYLARMRVQQSIDNLEDRNPYFFGELLRQPDMWRIFPDFRYSTAYLDIETNGRNGLDGSITTIAMYDGQTLRHYVRGHNLDEFIWDLVQYNVLVTYNGTHFDIPVIERYFRVKLSHVHIDLMYLLRTLGLKGGLKGCEKSLGLNREKLDGLDGYFAVLLWKEFRKNKNDRALETLLAYNILDAANLEILLVMAYNMKLVDTPFAETYKLSIPKAIENPFKPDMEIIYQIRDQYGLW